MVVLSILSHSTITMESRLFVSASQNDHNPASQYDQRDDIVSSQHEYGVWYRDLLALTTELEPIRTAVAHPVDSGSGSHELSHLFPCSL